MPKISVVMGIYNCADTLSEALNSLLLQTYQDFNVIMCDDGSKDNTKEIALSFVKSHPDKFILIENKENLGLNKTLNKCIKISDGDYIARMDGDDLSVPTRFEKEINFLLENPEYALVSSPMIMFDENGEWGQTSVIQYPTVNDFCKHSPFFCHAAVMMKKSVLSEVGGYTEDKKFLRVEDCNLWFKIYEKGYKGANLTEPLYLMRDDRNAIGRRNLTARLNGCYVVFDGFKRVNMPRYKYFYAIKNVIVEVIKGVVPIGVYKYIHKRKFDKN